MTDKLDTTNPNAPDPGGSGPFVAEVIGVYDSDKMGRLKVRLVRAGSNKSEYVVKYLSPFFGTTPYSAVGGNPKAANDSQTSYGMWFVPPDIGNQVLVIFANASKADGFWIGCIPEKGTNYMVPGIASSEYTEIETQFATKIGTKVLPVTEHNKRTTSGSANPNIDKNNRPVHTSFALRLAEQGLLKDSIRGITTSSARRDAPSMVFGISTPGPKILNGKVAPQGEGNTQVNVPVNREGGSQFIMDDGAVTTDKNGVQGVVDECIRIRTRTGHQILLHNSADLIYISNSKGSAWLEMTSDGKLDVFCQDSISMHTEGDFNFRADRDVNIEALRNINMSSSTETRIEAGAGISMLTSDDFNVTAWANINLNTGKTILPLIGGKLRIQAMNGIEMNQLNPLGKIYMNAFGGIVNRSVTGHSIYDVKGITMSGATWGVKAASSTLLTGATSITAAATSIKTGTFSVSSGDVGINCANFGVSGANIGLTGAAVAINGAGGIDLNGPAQAVPAFSDVASSTVGALSAALDVLTALKPPEGPTLVVSLDRITLTNRQTKKSLNQGNKVDNDTPGWENNNYYRAPSIKSIMARVPTHEPYDYHENIDPDKVTRAATDRESYS